ncbi:hypothetical protein GCM10009716_21690 [Streptomyces sodiiphilus]|uniref:Uncharacterized protein n=1 Tax=Streptomyces sodiiphilus TaxID=226217 RepID=A0ABN2P3Q1_9ACTN
MVTGAALRVMCRTTTEPGATWDRTVPATASGSVAKASPPATSHCTAVSPSGASARSASSSWQPPGNLKYGTVRSTPAARISRSARRTSAANSPGSRAGSPQQGPSAKAWWA